MHWRRHYVVDALTRQELCGRGGLPSSQIRQWWISGAGAVGALVAVGPCMTDDDEIHGRSEMLLQAAGNVPPHGAVDRAGHELPEATFHAIGLVAVTRLVGRCRNGVTDNPVQ